MVAYESAAKLYPWVRVAVKRCSGDQARFQFLLINGELANSLSQFFGGHSVLVHHPAKRFFIELEFSADIGDALGIEFALQVGIVVGERLHQSRADSQAITAGQLLDFAGIAKTGTHDHGFVAVVLVVIVNLGNRTYPGVLLAAMFLTE